ncbi:hypothetical protein AALP_AA6G252900 [Arabis alpina]|uniref:Uncharacterized protein n=1 Tax=Arabis alpina TaxID=50452 RepID=A0A087GRL5_ARAAL|nr:hypothetical protein AALP_AA6G252900 [Arabis alpina]
MMLASEIVRATPTSLSDPSSSATSPGLSPTLVSPAPVNPPVPPVPPDPPPPHKTLDLQPYLPPPFLDMSCLVHHSQPISLTSPGFPSAHAVPTPPVKHHRRRTSPGISRPERSPVNARRNRKSFSTYPIAHCFFNGPCWITGLYGLYGPL